MRHHETGSERVLHSVPQAPNRGSYLDVRDSRRPHADLPLWRSIPGDSDIMLGPHSGVKVKILLEARILCVADVVEAMASHRPYRPALGVDAALEEISTGKGRRFDSAVVEACVALFREKGFTLTD
jgi:hypothetical protein